MSTQPTGSQQPTHRRIPLSLSISIAALAIISLLVIVALFTGNMDTFGGEIVTTIVYFAVFVGTLIGALAISSRSGTFPLPLAVVADVFVMAFGMVLIWIRYMAPNTSLEYDYYDSYSSVSNSWMAFFILVPIWIVVFIPVLIAWAGTRLSRGVTILRGLSTATALLFCVLAVLSFVPVLAERSFGVDVTELYWRVVAAVWILAIALVAIYALLLWFYRRDTREHVVPPASAAPQVSHYGMGHVPSGASYGTPHAQVISGAQGVPASRPAQTELTPWPFAEDGVTPLAVGRDGLPVFASLRTFDGRPSAVQPGDPEALAAIERGRIAAGR